MKQLHKRRAVVTGGTRGIGLAIAKKLQANGHEVLITGTTNHSIQNENFIYHKADFSSLNDIQKFSEFLTSYSPDILVNNAGINVNFPFEEISMALFLKIQQVNVTAPFRLCQAVLPSMKKNSWGRIINIASIWSKISKAGRASYSASKFGLDGLTAALAAEVAAQNILVNCVSPGFIDTDLTRQTLGEEGIKKMLQQVPIHRLGKVEEIGAYVAWLASEENTFISGQNLVIDGGFTRV